MNTIKKAVKIEAPKEATAFIKKYLAEKRERRNDIKRKFQSGELKMTK